MAEDKAKPEIKLPEGFTAVISSNLAGVAFMDKRDLVNEKGATEIQVIFKNGTRYHYEDCDDITVAQLKITESAGRFLNSNLKGKFRCYQADLVTGAKLPPRDQ